MQLLNLKTFPPQRIPNVCNWVCFPAAFRLLVISLWCPKALQYWSTYDVHIVICNILWSSSLGIVSIPTQQPFMWFHCHFFFLLPSRKHTNQALVKRCPSLRKGGGNNQNHEIVWIEVDNRVQRMTKAYMYICMCIYINIHRRLRWHFPCNYNFILKFSFIMVNKSISMLCYTILTLLHI